MYLEIGQLNRLTVVDIGCSAGNPPPNVGNSPLGELQHPAGKVLTSDGNSF